MLKISYRTQFKKELKLQIKRGKEIRKFLEVAEKLANAEQLDPKYKNHKFVGNFKGRWECYIEPDWLIVYATNT